MPQPVIYTPSIYSASSIFTSTVEDSEEDGFDLEQLDLWEGYDSPPPVNERHAGLRNERRYRLLLTHEFHPSRESFLYDSEELESDLGCLQ